MQTMLRTDFMEATRMGQPVEQGDRSQTNPPTTILVVEDDRVARMALEDIFDLLGYRCLMAQDGAEALRLYTQHPGEIGLVLSDLRMPNMDGAELARRLTALDPQVKVVLSSGYAAHEQRYAIHEGTISGWIQKPYSLEQLVALIRQLLDG
jgi:CheY-like chemotaxis protein